MRSTTSRYKSSSAETTARCRARALRPRACGHAGGARDLAVGRRTEPALVRCRSATGTAPFVRRAELLGDSAPSSAPPDETVADASTSSPRSPKERPRRASRRPRGRVRRGVPLLGMVGHPHDGSLLPQVVPFVTDVFVDARDPATSRQSGGGRPPQCQPQVAPPCSGVLAGVGSTGGCDTSTMMVGGDGSNHRWNQPTFGWPPAAQAEGPPGSGRTVTGVLVIARVVPGNHFSAPLPLSAETHHGTTMPPFCLPAPPHDAEFRCSSIHRSRSTFRTRCSRPIRTVGMFPRSIKR